MGKKIGIVALVLAVIYIIISVIGIFNKPEIPDEWYELMQTDREAAEEMLKNIEEPTLFKIADNMMFPVLWGTLIVGVVSLILMIKNKEKGKVLPILAMIIVIVMLFVTVFSLADMGKIIDASMQQVMEQNQ